MDIKKIILSYVLIFIYANAIPIYNPIDIRVQPMDVVVSPTTNIIVYPMDEDEDGDGVLNNRDAFPANPNEWLDTDHDGIGNNADKDDDGDGISDALERANGLNPLNAADAQADFDDDGFSNLIEILAGTNIRNAQSKPTWVPVMMGDIIIYVPAIP